MNHDSQIPLLIMTNENVVLEILSVDENQHGASSCLFH